ncbi:MAG: hypothetical protein J5902_03605 [Paludibacteraceae bacterium]|nr:hypothetical protein [Paludibacteraceae bacterium]
MKRYSYIIIGLLAALVTACDTNTTTTAKSSVAQLTAFSFAKNDTMPGLAKAVFTVEERLDTGLVWNKDSIQYGTRLEKVVPRFVFASTPGSAYLRTADTLCILTGYDTLDFTKTPIYLTIRSQDGSTTKTYEIRPTVHTKDPDLYEWTQLKDAIYLLDDSEQRVLELDKRFVMVKSNGYELDVFSSEDGIDWTHLGEPTGLPDGTGVRQIISNGDTLFYGKDDYVYTSTDGLLWTAHSVSYPVSTMVLYWNKRVWAMVDNNGRELALWNGTDLEPSGLKTSEDDFPVSDFATVCFHSASGRERAMIMGGFAESGRALNSRWNLEYSRHTPENNGYRLQEFSVDRPAFKALTGISVIWYNNRLLMFGGVDADMKYQGRDILISTDEGLNWTAADTTKNKLPEVYTARQKQTALVRDNYIYLFGGQDAYATYSDVYRGKLNSIDW